MMIKKKIFILTAMLLIGSWTYTFAQNEHNVLPAEASDANNTILEDVVARQVSEQILFRIGESTIDTSYMGNAQRLEKFVKTNGSGMSYSYELSPEAKQRTKERATAVVQRQAAEHQPEQPIQDPITTSITTPAQAKSWSPFIALKTDLMLWGGVIPGFEMGTWTPNLSAEIYFARCWSAQAGYAYSNWNKFAGTKELYAVSAADMEVRHWFGKQSQFKGFYLGVYGQYGQYDIQKGIQGQTGSFWCAGLGAGWMQSLSRHWALEAEIRGGYRSAQNNIYDIEEGHNYFNKKQTIGKFTPQFRLQVVYRIGKTQK